MTGGVLTPLAVEEYLHAHGGSISETDELAIRGFVRFFNEDSRRLRTTCGTLTQALIETWAVLDEYFDFDLDSTDPDAVMEPSDRWRLHRDLVQLRARIALANPEALGLPIVD